MIGMHSHSADLGSVRVPGWALALGWVLVLVSVAFAFAPVLSGSDGYRGSLAEVMGPPFGLVVLPVALVLLHHVREERWRLAAVGVAGGALLAGALGVIVIGAESVGGVVFGGLLLLAVGLVTAVVIIRPIRTKIILAGGALGLLGTVSLTALGIAVVDEAEFAIAVPVTVAVGLGLCWYLRRVGSR